MSPRAAAIFLEDQRIGVGSCTADLAQGTQTTIRAEAPGYQVLRQQILADQDRTLFLKLRPLKQPATDPEGDLQENPYR